MRTVGPDQIHVLQSRPAVDYKVLVVLAEKPGAFAKEKIGDQTQHHHRNHRVASEEELDRIVESQAKQPQAAPLDRKGPGGRGFHGQQSAGMLQVCLDATQARRNSASGLARLTGT